jgi:hypothetical protein
MTHDDGDDDERQVVVLPRPALLAELARRAPDSPEGCALGIFRRVFGEGASGHLDQAKEGLMLVVEVKDHFGAVQRVGYLLDETGKFVRSWQLQDTGTGELEQRAMLAPIELEVALRMLASVGVVCRRD